MALLASYLRQPGSARDFSRIVRDVIRWRGQTRNLFDRVTEISELPPVRLFWGARDIILPVSQGTAIAALLENCELVRFENSGHFVHWEEPDGFAFALRAFLDSANVPPVKLRSAARAIRQWTGAGSLSPGKTCRNPSTGTESTTASPTD